MTPATRAVGNRRLLKLADILDTADAKHRKRGEPCYYQNVFMYDCGAPACALGHWAAANPRRWRMAAYGYPVLREWSKCGLSAAKLEFNLNDGEAVALFDSWGCGDAKTAKQAAKYIRAFVKRREK